MTNTFDQVRRVAKIALVGGVSIMVAGWAAEMWWFGRTDDSSFARVERAVRRSFDDRALALLETTRAVASHPDISADLNQPAARLRLFELSRAAVDRFADAGLSITVYDDAGLARAWAGRPSEIPDERILGDRAYFVAPGPLGLRLVYVEPILVGSDANMRRVGAVAGERVLSPALGLQDQSPNSYQLTASIANARLRTLYEGAGTIPGTLTFPLQSPDGDLLLEADVLEGDLVAARNTWRRSVLFVTMIGLAFALVVGCATLLARPRRGYPASDVMAPGLASATGCVLAYGLVRGAFSLDVGSPSIFDPSAYQSGLWPGLLRMPADVVSLGLLSGGLVLVSAFVVDQVRVGGHARRRLPSGLLDGRLLAWRIAGGAALASIVLLFDAFTRDAFQQSSVDLLHLSLQPWSAALITMQVGLLLLGAAALWGGVTVLVASQIGWQLSHRRVSFTVIAAVTWLARVAWSPSYDRYRMSDTWSCWGIRGRRDRHAVCPAAFSARVACHTHADDVPGHPVPGSAGIPVAPVLRRGYQTRLRRGPSPARCDAPRATPAGARARTRADRRPTEHDRPGDRTGRRTRHRPCLSHLATDRPCPASCHVGGGAVRRRRTPCESLRLELP